MFVTAGLDTGLSTTEGELVVGFVGELWLGVIRNQADSPNLRNDQFENAPIGFLFFPP
jgi:hypothetical protein